MMVIAKDFLINSVDKLFDRDRGDNRGDKQNNNKKRGFYYLKEII